MERKLVNSGYKWEKRNIDHLGRCIRFGDDLYTSKIRTCTGGGLVDPYNEICGFHILNSEHHNKYIKDILAVYLKKIDAKRALIIGSKNAPTVEYSVENFNIIKKLITSKIKDVTLFERHRFHYSESSFHYSAKKDTWTIVSVFDDAKRKNIEVTTLKNLLKAFKKIQIAKGDRLFMEGKEILPQECPKIFLDKNAIPKKESKTEIFFKKISKLLNFSGK